MINEKWLKFDEGTLFPKYAKLEFAVEKSKERVVFDGDYTIYYDKLGNKTTVHKMKDEHYDQEKAVMFAMLKSMGVKPKKIMDLIENSVDKAEKRKERELKKETAKQKKKSQPMKLYYEANGKLEFIEGFESREVAMQEITQFWASHGYKVPFFRVIPYEDYYWIDFGSHSQFYRLYKEGEQPHEEEC